MDIILGILDIMITYNYRQCDPRYIKYLLKEGGTKIIIPKNIFVKIPKPQIVHFASELVKEISTRYDNKKFSKCNLNDPIGRVTDTIDELEVFSVFLTTTQVVTHIQINISGFRDYTIWFDVDIQDNDQDNNIVIDLTKKNN